ncbi:arsenate reductase/protein-tyrosine-phosphatase family protein [Sphaerisporangium aureirubrum]|uniref:Phosphotyrosine protein phosphatase I domain-containing protein n=1 Tax=Sphaerisporangium aureirubrum TaxID=1544736 RepID=A0ABW1NSK2_9ACTN
MRGCPETAEDLRFRVLFVCTGNICRSPMAERLLLAAMTPGAAVVAASAGIHAEPGTPMAGEALRVLGRAGAVTTGFAARRLDAEMIVEADLVLTAERAHRAWVVSRVPRAASRTFTIVEFGALVTAVPRGALDGYGDAVCRARGLTGAAHELRGLVHVDQPDLRDPYGRSARAYRATARRVQDALAAPIEVLTAPVRHPPVVPAGS